MYACLDMLFQGLKPGVIELPAPKVRRDIQKSIHRARSEVQRIYCLSKVSLFEPQSLVLKR